MIMRTEEITPDKTVHLRGKIEIEVEDRRCRFEVQEDESPTVTMHDLYRNLQTNSNEWQLVSANRHVAQPTDRLFPGRKHYMIRNPVEARLHPTPEVSIAIQVSFRRRENHIHVFP
jgi:hypothetical protein